MATSVRAKPLKTKSDTSLTQYTKAKKGSKQKQFSVSSRSKSNASFRNFQKLHRVSSQEAINKGLQDPMKKSRSSESLNKRRVHSGLSMTALVRTRSHPVVLHPHSHSLKHKGLMSGKGNGGSNIILDFHDSGDNEDESATDEEVESFTDEGDAEYAYEIDDMNNGDEAQKKFSKKSSHHSLHGFQDKAATLRMDGNRPIQRALSYKPPSRLRNRVDTYDDQISADATGSDSGDKIDNNPHNEHDDVIDSNNQDGSFNANSLRRQGQHIFNFPHEESGAQQNQLQQKQQYRNQSGVSLHEDLIRNDALVKEEENNQDSHIQNINVERKGKEFEDNIPEAVSPTQNGTKETPHDAENSNNTGNRNNRNETKDDDGYNDDNNNSKNGNNVSKNDDDDDDDDVTLNPARATVEAQASEQYVPDMILSQSTGMEKRFDQLSRQSSLAWINTSDHPAERGVKIQNDKSNTFNYINQDLAASIKEETIDESVQQQQQLIMLQKQKQQHKATKSDFSTSISSLTSHLTRPVSRDHMLRGGPSSQSRNGQPSLYKQPSFNENEVSNSMTDFSSFLQYADVGGDSRTQQKLWLQRENSIQDLTSQNVFSDSIFLAANVEVRREFERISREYTNVRRFSNPLVESISRISQQQSIEIHKHKKTTPSKLSGNFYNVDNGKTKITKLGESLPSGSKMEVQRILTKLWNTSTQEFHKDENPLMNRGSELLASQTSGTYRSMRPSRIASSQHQRAVNSLHPTTRAVNRRMEYVLGQQHS